MNELQRDARLFWALSHPNRLLILSLLQEQDGTLSVDELLDKLVLRDCDIEQPTLSYHLKELRKAGIVTYAKHHTLHYYSICPGIQDKLACMVEQYAGRTQACEPKQTSSYFRERDALNVLMGVQP